MLYEDILMGNRKRNIGKEQHYGKYNAEYYK